MTQKRSKRRLILDRLERNIRCHEESARRLEEIMGFYAEGEETYPTRYVQLMAMTVELLKAEKKLREAYDTFYEMAKP